MVTLKIPVASEDVPQASRAAPELVAPEPGVPTTRCVLLCEDDS